MKDPRKLRNARLAGTGQPTLSNMDSQATRVKGKEEHLNESGQNMVAFSESTGHAGTGQAYSPDQSSAELCKRSSAVIDMESGGSVSKLIKRKNTESASGRGSNLTTEFSGFSIDGDSLSVRSKSEKQTQPDDKKHLEPVQPEQISHTPLLPGVVFERSSDGVGIVPLVIGSYEDLMISEQEYDVIKKLGRKSYTSNSVGMLVPCSVLKLRNCFAVPVQEDKQIKLIWMMSALCLKKKVRTSDGRVFVDIEIADDLGNKLVRIPYSTLTENGIKRLSKYDVRLFGNYALTMAIYLQKLADELPMEDASQQLGIVIKAGTKRPHFNCYADHLFTSKCSFDDFAQYLKQFNQLLQPSVPLQFLLAATMGALSLTLLQTYYNFDLHSYCINIVGSSSTGKTIASRVCAAVWTNPTDEAIFSAMLSTGNAALKRLAGRYGIPTFLDEATILGGVKADEYAYSVYEGREKKRLNSDCSEKASGTWSTVVCMSSEQHFHSIAKNQNGGLAVRVHAIENLPWTASKDHADALNMFIKDNYGVLGKRFAKLVLSDEILDKLPERYESAKDTMATYCSDAHNDFTDRLCQIYALTYLTAELLEKMGVAIDLEGVACIMADHNAMVGKEQNLALNAFRAIVSYAARNSYRDGIRYIHTDHADRVAVEEDLFRSILEKAGFADIKVTVKELDKAGFLVRQVSAGLKSKLTISGNLCWCYQIDLSSLSESDDPVVPQSDSQKKAETLRYLTADPIELELDENALAKPGEDEAESVDDLDAYEDDPEDDDADDDPEAYDIADEYEGDPEDDDDDDDTDTFLTVYSDLDEDDYEEL